LFDIKQIFPNQWLYAFLGMATIRDHISILPILFTLSILCNISFLIYSYRQHIVVSVPDGDSLQLADGRRIRLIGLDAPERGACAADEARMTLEKAAKGKHVRLKHIVTDDYGRQLAHVIVEDFSTWMSYIRHRVITSLQGVPKPFGFFSTALDDGYVDPYISRLMVSSGLAKFGSAKDEYYETLKAAQAVAKQNNLGIYSSTCRKRSSDDPSCTIKGNIRAGIKTFHMPDCKNYTQTVIDTSFNDRWFCSEEEAETAGFSKASGCPN